MKSVILFLLRRCPIAERKEIIREATRELSDLNVKDLIEKVLAGQKVHIHRNPKRRAA